MFQTELSVTVLQHYSKLDWHEQFHYAPAVYAALKHKLFVHCLIEAVVVCQYTL
jgi:hypothetical protein